MVVVEGDVYCSDTDSDDDVDRYVLLARQPEPAAGRHSEDDDRGESSANDEDDDGDATEDDKEEPPERGHGRMKRKPLREISDDVPPPSPRKKARVELTAPSFVRTQLSGSGSETESDSAAPLPFGVRAGGESGSEGSHDKAHVHHRAPGKKKRGVCGGKRRRGPGCEEDGDREAVAAAKIATTKTGASPTETHGRFLCNQCERCFDSHQALGGHVLGHRKKEKIAIAAAAAASLDLDDAGGAGNYKEETAVAEVSDEETTANGIAQADDVMMTVVAARRGKGKGNGGGTRDGKIKTVDFVAEHREDVDDDRVNGNPGFGNKGNAKVVSSGRDFTNGNYRSINDKTGIIIGAAILGKKVVVGACHEGANGDGNEGRTLYKCKVCGAECTTGRALGGHMRKHRVKRPPAGGGEGRSPSPPTDDDYRTPLARLFGADTIGLV